MEQGADATVIPFRRLKKPATARGPASDSSLGRDLGEAVLSVLARWGIPDPLAARLLGLERAQWVGYRTSGHFPEGADALHAACDLLKLRRLVEGTGDPTGFGVAGREWLRTPFPPGDGFETPLDLLASRGAAGVRQLCTLLHNRQ